VLYGFVGIVLMRGTMGVVVVGNAFPVHNCMLYIRLFGALIRFYSSSRCERLKKNGEQQKYGDKPVHVMKVKRGEEKKYTCACIDG